MTVSNLDKLDYRNYVTLSTPMMSPPKSQVIACSGSVTSPPARTTLASVKQGDILYLLSREVGEYDVKHTFLVKDTRRYFPPDTAEAVIGFMVENACQEIDAPVLSDMLCINMSDSVQYHANVVSNGEYNLDILCVDKDAVREVLSEHILREEKILRDDIKNAKKWLHNRRDEMRKLKKAKKFYKL